MIEQICPSCYTKTAFPDEPSEKCPHCNTLYLNAQTIRIIGGDDPTQEPLWPIQEKADEQISQQETQDHLKKTVKTFPGKPQEKEVQKSEALTVESEAPTVITSPKSPKRQGLVGLDNELSITSKLSTGGTFGKYQIVEKLAQGGMGAVFKVYHPVLQQEFALKVLLEGQNVSENQISRFHLEAKSCSRMRHKHIVSVHDVGEEDGIHYLTMDLIHGGDLAQALIERDFEITEVVGLVQKICESLVYAHQQNILHRDLKPANILLDKYGEPFVTDFGLAKDISKKEDLTQEGSILGTPAYMPPEQAMGEVKKMGPHSDVYSMGAILYEMLTGVCPITAERSLELLQKIISAEPTPPRKINPLIPKDIETICMKCLEKEPEKRYQTMEEMLADINCYLEGKPILARPVTAAERFWKLIKRHKTLSTTIVFFSFLLLLSLVWVWKKAQEKQFLQQEQNRIQQAIRQQNEINGLLKKAKRLEHDGVAENLIRKIYQEAFAVKADQSEAYLQFGRFLLNRELLYESIKSFKQALLLNNKLSSAHFLLALAYQRLEKYPEARTHLEAFRRIDATNPGSPTDLFLKATQCAKDNLFEEALAFYNQALKDSPNFIEALNNRAFLLLQLERYQEALRDLDTLLTQFPNLVTPRLNRVRIYLLQNPPQLEAAKKDLRYILEVLQTKIPEVWVYLTQCYLRSNDLAAAEKVIEEGKKIFPNSPLLFQEQGILAFEQENDLQAKEFFLKALALSKAATLAQLFKSNFYLARIFDREKQWEKAYELLKKAKSSSLEFQILYGKVLCRLGLPEGFRLLCQILSKERPDFEEFLLKERETRILMMQQSIKYGNYELLDLLAAPILDEYQYHPQANAWLALKETYQGEKEKAQQYLKQAKKGCYKKTKETLWLAQFYLQHFSPEEAAILLTPFVEKNSDSFAVLFTLAKFFQQKQEWEKALKCLNPLIAQEQRDPEFYAILGLLKCQQKDEEGILHLEKAIQLGGESYQRQLFEGYFLLGKIEEKHFNTKWRFYLEDFELFQARFWCQKKEWEKTHQALEKVFLSNPNSFPGFLLKIQCLWEEKKKIEAKAIIQKAKMLRQNHPEIVRYLKQLQND